MTVKPMEIAGGLPDHEGRMVPCVTLEQAEGYALEFAKELSDRLGIDFNHADVVATHLANEMYLAQHPNTKPRFRWIKEPGPNDE